MNRIEFLKNQYAAKITQATSNEPQLSTTFDDLVLLDSSPNKRYTDWLCRLAIAKKLKVEDHYKVPQALESFSRFKNLLKKEGLPVDINAYETLAKVMSAVLKFELARENGELVGKNEELRAQSEKARAESVELYEDENYRIVVPLTEFASVYYGRNTRWCTAASESDNAFKSYSDGSKKFLYIFFDKNANTKLQYSNNDSNIADAADDYHSFDEAIKKFVETANIESFTSEAYCDSDTDFDKMQPSQKAFLAFVASPLMKEMIKEQKQEQLFEELTRNYYDSTQPINKLLLCDLFKKKISDDTISTVLYASRYFPDMLKETKKDGDYYVLTPLEVLAAVSGSGWNIKDLSKEQMEIEADPIIQEMNEKGKTDKDEEAALAYLCSYINECADGYYQKMTTPAVTEMAKTLKDIFKN